MTTFHPQQSDCGRRVQKMAHTSTHEIHVTNCPTKLHSHGHEARKNVCSKFQGTVQEHVNEWSFYTREALPLSRAKVLRLANGSPELARSPVRWSRDDREPSGKKSGEMSRATVAQCPRNRQATADVSSPDDRRDDLQDNLRYANVGRAASALESCETTHNLFAQRRCNGRANGPRKIPQATRKIPTASFQPSQLNIMNTPTTPQPTLDLESLRKAIQEFRPNPHRVPFNILKPFHDSIVELRAKRASYRSVAELLQQHGVKTSRARVAEYGRIVLEGGKKRKRQKRTKSTPAANAPATLPSAPTVAAQPAPATPPATAITSEVPPPPKESSPYRSRGPHIANVRMMSPEEKADFDAFLKAKNAPKS